MARKITKLSIKDFIKDNSPGSRLQSLRLPRDLSLGGTKLSKKIYKPNLNVVRTKRKTQDMLKTERVINAQHDNFQNKHKDKYVQSSGVFSEGIGNSNRLEKRLHQKESEKLPHILKESLAPAKKLRTREVAEIVRCEEDSNSDNDEKLPFSPVIWNASKLLKDVINEEVKLEKQYVESKLLTSARTLPPEFRDTEEHVKSNAIVTLWQLPDSFAFKNNSEKLKTKKLTDCKLTDLPEGKIGKICVRRSGKINVQIGNLKYELESAHFETFVEEIVTLNIRSPQDSTASVLGNIQSRFVLNPSWQSFLH